jgi:hypothetical protein
MILPYNANPGPDEIFGKDIQAPKPARHFILNVSLTQSRPVSIQLIEPISDALFLRYIKASAGSSLLHVG